MTETTRQLCMSCQERTPVVPVKNCDKLLNPGILASDCMEFRLSGLSKVSNVPKVSEIGLVALVAILLVRGRETDRKGCVN